MTKNRLEAFSDGVLAIIITIMVLELKVPHGAELSDILPLAPTFLAYILSFVFIGIYWNNHHHMFQIVHKVSGSILWANMGLLFWLSLVPFATAWMGENHFAQYPVALYGVVLFGSAVSYTILSHRLIAHNGGKESALARAYQADFKGKISLVTYIFAIAVSFFYSWISLTLYVFVAILWLIPDRRIEKLVS
jgi:uncharacterized membrane protein